MGFTFEEKVERIDLFIRMNQIYWSFNPFRWKIGLYFNNESIECRGQKWEMLVEVVNFGQNFQLNEIYY